MTRLMAVLIAVDQLANTLLAGFPDETLSSRAYRCGELALTPKRRWVWVYKGLNLLFFWQPNHCEQAHLSEVARLHSPRMYRL